MKDLVQIKNKIITQKNNKYSRVIKSNKTDELIDPNQIVHIWHYTNTAVDEEKLPNLKFARKC